MRILMWHVDHFKSELTEQGRSPLVEPADDRVTEVNEALLVFASVERQDEESPGEVATRCTAEIADHCRRLGVKVVVLHPFAHLFGELSSPATAVRVLDEVKTALEEQGLEAQRTPFGWFNTLELRAKGHPLSRVARTVSSGPGTQSA